MNAERREYLEMQLSAYLDGELTPQEQAEVEAWLAADPEARRLLAQLRATVDAVQSLPRAHASEELLGNLRTRLERKALLDTPGPVEVITRTPALSWGKWVAAAAVIALTVTAGYFTWTLRSEQQVAGPQLASRDEAPARKPSAATEKIEQDDAVNTLIEHREARDTTGVAAPAVLPPASARPARKPLEPAPGGAPALLVEGKLFEKLNEGESVHAERGKKGDVLAEAPAAREAVAGALTSGAGEDALGDKKPDTLSFAGRLGGDGERNGAIQHQYALVPQVDPAEGRTRVLTLSFADASSRSKAIESLQRELLLGETNKGVRASAAFRGTMQQGVTAQPGETRPAEMAYQPSAPTGDSVRLRKQETVLRAPRSGGVNGAFDEDWSASLGAVKVTSIDTNPDSPTNVLKVVAVDGASADRLVAVLKHHDWYDGQYGRFAEAESVEHHDHKAKEGGPGPDRRLTVTADDSADGVPDSMDLSKAFPKPSATQPSQDWSRLSGVDTITLSDRLTTWDVPLVSENDGGDDAMTDEQGVANLVYDMALRPDRSVVLDADAEPHATTSPANSPQAEASYGMGGMGMMGSAVAGTGLSGMGAGYGTYGAAQGGGSTSRYAGSASVRSDHSAMSVVQSRPADSNLLVVYFEVLSPDTQPATPAASSAPASAEPTSRPATHP